ncbi:putative F-box protein At5g38810 [Silene latifolia]|uniref:putative F-box protein At5g38810 n=1 Tax=Silene latifolia TaxID=37657 RepID=UPI003D77B6BC
MKEKNNCVVASIMAMWDLICHYLGDCQNGSTISSLPDEIIINILSRVSAETILACRAVCSAWHHITNTTQFTQLHRIRSNNPVILGRVFNSSISYSSPRWFFIGNFRFYNVEITGLESVRRASKPHVQAVCDGLIIFKHSVNYTDSYVICNPITREEVEFRLQTNDNICGFYYHKVQKEYALLIYQKNDQYEYSIYGLTSKDRRTISTRVEFNPNCCGVSTCGALFWIIYGSKYHNSLSVNTESILMFNLETEKFTVKDHPADRYKQAARNQLKLLEIDGKLGCCDVYSKSVQVWILEDVENWKWAKRYVVDLNRILNENYGDRSIPQIAKTCVVATLNGDLLLFRGLVGLLWWNRRLNKVSKMNTGTLDMTDLSIVCDAVSFTSSLISLRQSNILP